MKYHFKMWKNGDCVKEDVIPSDVLLSRIARVAVYLHCEGTKDCYKFHINYDEFFGSGVVEYEIIMKNSKTGDIIRHVYNPVYRETSDED